MKKLLLSIITFSVTSAATFAQCNELFISEYVEGIGNNKAIEIYNPTQNGISLANYRLIRWDNGNVLVEPFALENVLNLPANITLGSNQTYVIALNLTDPTGTGQTAPIDIALQAAADTLLCPGCATGTNESRVLCFNGDDALSLQKNNGGVWINVDIFGCIGERPSNSAGNFSPTAGWTILPPFSSMPASYNSSTQGPYFLQYWSQDKTLIRKGAVESGVAANPAPASFNASLQWDTLPSNTYTNLGIHSCACFPQSVTSQNVLSQNTILFPNPATTGVVNIQTKQFTGNVQLINTLGEVVRDFNVKNLVNNFQIDLANLPRGIYHLAMKSTLLDNNGAVIEINKKIILQ